MLSGIVLTLTFVSVIAMYVPINIGVSTAIVTISESGEYLIVDVSDLTPHKSMYGKYWYEANWSPNSGRLDIACMSTRSRLGKLGAVSKIQIRAKKSIIDKGVSEFGVYTVSSGGERILRAKLQLH